jgi:hypothetical protein
MRACALRAGISARDFAASRSKRNSCKVVSVVQKNTLIEITRIEMRVLPKLSKAPAPVIRLVISLVEYVKTSEELLEITAQIWPQLQVYHGHTHLRLMPTGDAEGDSIYVDID